jgi:hypothetical protein
LPRCPNNGGGGAAGCPALFIWIEMENCFQAWVPLTNVTMQGFQLKSTNWKYYWLKYIPVIR